VAAVTGTSSVTPWACPHDCPDTCSTLVTVEDGCVVKVRGNPDHPFTPGRVVRQGHRLPQPRVRPRSRAHALVSTAYADMSRAPTFSDTAVQVERWTPAAARSTAPAVV
jgi:hypothetical protein